MLNNDNDLLYLRNSIHKSWWSFKIVLNQDELHVRLNVEWLKVDQEEMLKNVETLILMLFMGI